MGATRITKSLQHCHHRHQHRHEGNLLRCSDLMAETKQPSSHSIFVVDFIFVFAMLPW